MLTQEHLDKVAAFHGHICLGMLIEFKAVEGAIAQLGLGDEALPAVNEEIVAVVENETCGVDAVQVLLGCTYGKSKLIARICGKMALGFFSRNTGKSVRLMLKPPFARSSESDAPKKKFVISSSFFAESMSANRSGYTQLPT